MYLDLETELSDSQALTATANSTNVVDLLSNRSMGNGEPMSVVISIEVDADQGTGDESYVFDVVYASDSGLTTDVQSVDKRVFEAGTPTAPNQNADLLVTGFKVEMSLPSTTLDESNRYIGVIYTLAGTTPSVTVSAHLIPQQMVESADGVTYPSGYTITS